MKDLGRRFITSSISILCVVCLLYFAYHPWARYLTIAAVGALSAIALWEYSQFARVKGSMAKTSLLMILSACVTLSFALPSLTWRYFPEVAFFLSLLILFAHHFRKREGAIVDLAVSAFGLLYIALPLGMILGILYGSHGEDGRIWAAYLLAMTKLTDMGGYFGGSLWGKHKLAPTISPGKTLEGALCGLAVALATSYLFSLFGSMYGGLSFSLDTSEWIALGLILGSIGQFGDLSESLLKRDANKKDSNSLPGLGGVLDMLDSLLFNAPLVYCFLIALRS